MDIVAAVFIEEMEMRQAPGPSARIDLTGVHFSLAAPSPVPVTIEPHLLILVRCRPDEPGQGVLEVIYRRDDEQIARNVQPLQVEPGKFNYRLVRAQLEFTEYGVVEAHCRLDGGATTIVPLTLLPPAG